MKKFLTATTLMLTLTVGCAAPATFQSPEVLGVDRERAGTATYDMLVQGAVSQLLDEVASRSQAQGRASIAFIDLEGRGVEELRDHRSAILDTIGTELVNSDLFRLVSMRMVNAAKRSSGVTRADDLFLKEPRERFLSVLFDQGIDPKYFLWGRMTTQTSNVSGRGLFDGDKVERKYLLTLDMVDSKTGEVVAQKQTDLVKLYR